MPTNGRNRKGDWLQTYSGDPFWPLDPRPDDIRIEDIAHSLSLICRFGGHCRTHYSVAQHSVLVSRLCDSVDALWGLFHDAAETYVGDMPRPIKDLPELRPYRRVEVRIMMAVVEAFDLRRTWLKTAPPREVREMAPPSVLQADAVALATERRDLMAPSEYPMTKRRFVGYVIDGSPLYERKPLPDPAPDTIMPWSPSQAEAAFLLRYKELKR